MTIEAPAFSADLTPSAEGIARARGDVASRVVPGWTAEDEITRCLSGLAVSLAQAHVDGDLAMIPGISRRILALDAVRGTALDAAT